MNTFVIVLVLLVLVGGAAAAIYFTQDKKKCKDHETQADCKEPCQWDTYGDKCIDEGDDMTPAPVVAAAGDAEREGRQSGPEPAPTGTGSSNKWKCYAGRYGDAYAAYQENKSLDDVEEHYKTIGKSKGWKTSCTLSGDEIGCYSLQNPEAFENFGYTNNSTNTTGKRLAKHYGDVGKDEVARFNCQGGKLAASTIPEDASILTPRELDIDRRNKKYKWLLTSPNGEYTLAIYHETKRARIFLRKGNANIATILDSRLSDANYSAGYTKLRAWFSGWDGNLYMRWYKPDGSGGYKDPVYINNAFPGTTNNTVQSNQHAIVLTNSGRLYVDHGLGDEDEISVLYEGDE